MSHQQIPVPSNCDLSKESENDLETTPSDVSSSNRTKALIKLVMGAGMMILSAAFNPFGRTPFSVPEGLQGHLVVTGWWIYGVASLLWVFGLIMVLWAVWTFVRPIGAGSSPEQTMHRFLWDVSDGFDRRMPLAWCCLLRSAKNEFPQGLKAFEEAWWDHSNKRRTRARFVLKNAKKKVPDQVQLKVASVRQVLSRAPFSVVEGIISAGGVDWIELRVLANVGKRWYLTDGRCYDHIPSDLSTLVKHAEGATPSLEKQPASDVPVEVSESQEGGKTGKPLPTDRIVERPELTTEPTSGSASLRGAGRVKSPDPILLQSECNQCGHRGFEYDRYYDEYSCENCGWQLKKVQARKPSATSNVATRTCPNCREPYNSVDYRPDTEVWLCRKCNKPLPRN